MAGDGVTYEWLDQDLQDKVSAYITRAGDMSPAMKGYADYLVTRTADRFDKEEAPDGSGWQSLKPATIARKKDQGKIDKILQQDGFLRLVHPESDARSAGVYTNKIYAAIHNRGGYAGRNRSVKIPKREFMGLNEEDIKEFQDTVADWVILGRRPS